MPCPGPKSCRCTARHISHSPTESEILAADLACREIMHLRNLLSELGYPQTEPTTLYDDSNGAIRNSVNPCFKKKLKHLPLEYHYTRERCNAGDIILVKIDGAKNPADIMTKSLRKGPFLLHLKKVLRDVPDP